MRDAFAKHIEILAQRDSRVVLLMGDIGNRMFNRFQDQFPGRFYNCGVAEQNMISMAAGIASEGLRPFCYTITPFITARCLEQIRIDVGYHETAVTIVGTGAGLSYASLGATHHSCDDIALMRAVPGINLWAPGDAMEVRSCMDTILETDAPAYMRIGKKGEPVIHQSQPEVRLAQFLPLRQGRRVALLSTGNLLPLVLESADLINASIGADAVTVMSCPCLRPLDEASLDKVFAGHQMVATLEEHGAISGFGSMVAEWLAARPGAVPARLLRFDTGDAFIHATHTQESAREALGLTSASIVARITAALD